jgi:glutaredoxin 3
MKPVRIYTRSMCIWCVRAKWLLRWHGASFEEIDASDEAIRADLLARTGMRTVPQVFFGDVSIGGFEALRDAIARGDLAATA